MDKHVRARCRATGHIAALPERALRLGHIPGWEQVPGPVPNGPKPAAWPPVFGEREDAADHENADSESANESEE